MHIDSMAAELIDILESFPHGSARSLLSPPLRGEVFLLGFLQNAGGLARPSEMRQAMGTSSARISAALGALVQKGYVTRDVDADDHRRTLVRLTPEGDDYAAAALAHVHQTIRSTLEALGHDDAQEYIRILRRILTITQQEGE